MASREDVVDADDEGEADQAPTDMPEDILDVDLGDDTTAPDSDSQVLEALDDVDKREEVSSAVLSICQSLFEAGRTTAFGQSTLRILSDIQTRLQEIDLTKAAPETHPGIGKQLQEIMRLTAVLTERNEKYLDGTLSHTSESQ